jgi:hypothetical protein
MLASYSPHRTGNALTQGWTAITGGMGLAPSGNLDPHEAFRRLALELTPRDIAGARAQASRSASSFVEHGRVTTSRFNFGSK